MRAIIPTFGAPGHFHPLVPLARAPDNGRAVKLLERLAIEKQPIYAEGQFRNQEW